MSIQFHVMLRITGELCSPEEITERTGITPTRSWHKGELLKGTVEGKTILRYEENGWELKSGLDLESPLEDHIKSVADAVSSASDVLREFTTKYDAFIECAAYFDETTPELCLDPELVGWLASLNLGLDIDLYPLGD
ncbi:MAG TPA: DUF4279 domain-containing protein [Blastocatellia bacterium]|nr:DUF4279 domain-containing protein [Blastocatellia bacterium]